MIRSAVAHCQRANLGFAGMFSKEERFRIFLDQLKRAPRSRSHDAALALLSTTLNQVEDELSGVPARPGSWRADGRMYPPQADMARTDARFPGVIVYRSRAHRTFIGENGSIIIASTFGEICLSKPGADGVSLDPAIA